MKATSIGEIIRRIDPKYRPVWENCPENDQWALAEYFLCLGSKKEILAPTRPRLIKWYCPFAHQLNFPSGHRYCINVFSGCSFNCEYCYAAGYMRAEAACKKDLEQNLLKDLRDLTKFAVPAAPLHISNSTDPFQPLEKKIRNTAYILRQVLNHRNSFTTVTLLTKNPELVADDEYLVLLRKLLMIDESHPKADCFRERNLPGCQVEVSLAFWNEQAREFYDPGAPTLESRKRGVISLRKAGIPVVLRIDPLFPRSPLPHSLGNLSDFGLLEAQSSDDLENLVKFAKEVNVRHIVFSPLKVVQSRRKFSAKIESLKKLYKALSAPCKPVWRGGSWRLPEDFSEHELIIPFKSLCDQFGVRTKFCMKNLVETF